MTTPLTTKPIVRIVDVHPEPQEMAAVFAEWNHEDQAAFLGAFAAISETWPVANRLKQLHAIGRAMSPLGGDAIREIAAAVSEGKR